MRSAAEHRAKAEQLLEDAHAAGDQISRGLFLAEAQVHATLALTAAPGTGPPGPGQPETSSTASTMEDLPGGIWGGAAGGMVPVLPTTPMRLPGPTAPRTPTEGPSPMRHPVTTARPWRPGQEPAAPAPPRPAEQRPARPAEQPAKPAHPAGPGPAPDEPGEKEPDEEEPAQPGKPEPGDFSPFHL